MLFVKNEANGIEIMGNGKFSQVTHNHIHTLTHTHRQTQTHTHTHNFIFKNIKKKLI